MPNSYIVIFKDITEGFMDLAKIDLLADFFEKHIDLKTSFLFLRK